MRFLHNLVAVESVPPLVGVLKSNIYTVPTASHANIKLSSYLQFGRLESNYKSSDLSLAVYFSIICSSYFVPVHLMSKKSGFISERIIM